MGSSLRTFDNSSLPRVVTVVNDGALAATINVPIGTTVVLGYTNNSALPVLDVFPAAPGGSPIDTILQNSYNKQADGTSYPSELSIIVEQLKASGVTDLQVVRVGNSDRVRDMNARMARERYIAYENAYALFVDSGISVMIPANVKLGLNGDGLYNAAVYETIYDPSLTLGGVVTNTLSRIPGYFQVATTDHEKTATLDKEDLAYQLADFCYTATTVGQRYCTGIVTTLSAIDVSHLRNTKFGSIAGQGTDFGTGAASTFTVDNVWSLDRVGSTSIGAQFVAANPTASANAVMAEIDKASLIVADPSLSTGIKEVLKRSVLPFIGDTFTSTASDVIEWNLLFGTPTRSDMTAWVSFLEKFGYTTNLIYGVTSQYREWDGVTSTTGEKADFYRIYATTSHEKPISDSDATIVKDANGRVVDIGHYIDAVTTNSRVGGMNNSNKIRLGSFIQSAADAQIAGWYFKNSSSRANTNLVTTVFTQNGPLSPSQAARLTKKRYQSFIIRPQGYTMARDITMGLYVNDFIRTDFINRMTTRILGDAVDVVQIISQPFLGRPNTAVNRAAIKQRIETELQEWKRPEDSRLLSFDVRINSDGTAEVLGKARIFLSLRIPGELIEITQEIGLAR